ncbi:hypothetical protein Dsin_010891 [Dipteronia sinensis]|uniref:Uncharacterized protein n=1 Tax=Dipteronia sinensis TaxID=43782 RepID=A0AAE0ED36_9ROSI|nr:hypothetical protein Dsin_010891 [Dipteronia sinensis]
MEDNKEEKKNTNGEDNGKTKKKKKKVDDQLPLMVLNHVSRLYRNVKDSINFYTKVLGFVLI